MGDGNFQNEVEVAQRQPVPSLHVPTPTAPGVRGPKGLSPRTDYARVNTGTVDPADAGSQFQKSISPMGIGQNKVSSVRVNNMNMAGKPTLQHFYKQASEGIRSAGSQKIAEEAQRQAGVREVETSPEITVEYAQKLASAFDFVSNILLKEASSAAHITETPQGPGSGPNPSTVTTPKDGPPPSDNTGKAQNQPPATGTQKGNDQEHGATLMKNTQDNPPGGGEKQKMASVGSLLKAMAKHAEDAINPAQISAGPTNPPQTNDASQPGPSGEDKAVVPETAEGVAALDKRTAKAPMRTDMESYLSEPMHAAAHDRVLQDSFEHTNQAGAKIAGIDPVKVAAAKALIQKMAESKVA